MTLTQLLLIPFKNSYPKEWRFSAKKWLTWGVTAKKSFSVPIHFVPHITKTIIHIGKCLIRRVAWPRSHDDSCHSDLTIFKIILQDFTFFIWNTGKFNQSFSQSGCLTRSDQKVREIQIPVIDTFKTGPMPNEPNYITNCQNGDSFCNGQWHDLVAFLLGQFWLWGMTQRFSVAFPTKVGTGRHVLWTYMHIYCEVMWTKQNVPYVFPIRIVETQHYIYVHTFVKVEAWNWVDSNVVHLAWHLS